MRPARGRQTMIQTYRQGPYSYWFMFHLVSMFETQSSVDDFLLNVVYTCMTLDWFVFISVHLLYLFMFETQVVFMMFF